MNLGIVILNWNGEELLREFLPSLIKFTPIKHNIYIIDNGSNDNSIGFVENNYKRIKVIKLDTNYGYAKGYNIGLKYINDEILCLLNNDVEVTENWTDNILKQFDLEPNTAVIQPKLKNYYEKSEFDYAGASGGYLDKYGYPYCDGRNYKIIEKLSSILNISDLKLNKDGKLLNNTFMFTGKLSNMSRAEAKSLIEENSGSVVSSVNKKLKYLIIGEKPTNRKVQKAKELGIKILSQKEWLNLLN